MSDKKYKQDNNSSWKEFWNHCYSGDYMGCYDLHRLIGFPFYQIAINNNIKANTLTVFAFLLRFISCFYFISENYNVRLIGLVWLNLGLAVDCIDGPVARHQKGSSKFGEWLASQLIAVKTITVWSSVIYGIYVSEYDPKILLYGLTILGHLFFTYYLLKEKAHFKIDSRGTVMYGRNKNNKIGLEFILDAILFITIISNYNNILQVLTILMAIPWILLFRQGYRSFD